MQTLRETAAGIVAKAIRGEPLPNVVNGVKCGDESADRFRTPVVGQEGTKRGGQIVATPELPQTCLPDWGVAELPEPPALSWRHWTRFIGPGIVMMGIQIGGGEWLFGPEITARYGGGLMWIATIAIMLQVFYNIECGRYALYCGEPVFTGFMRSRPGPMFWIGVMFVLNMGALIPGLSTHAAAMVASLVLDRPPPSLGLDAWSRGWPTCC